MQVDDDPSPCLPRAAQLMILPDGKVSPLVVSQVSSTTLLTEGNIAAPVQNHTPDPSEGWAGCIPNAALGLTDRIHVTLLPCERYTPPTPFQPRDEGPTGTPKLQ